MHHVCFVSFKWHGLSKTREMFEDGKCFIINKLYAEAYMSVYQIWTVCIKQINEHSRLYTTDLISLFFTQHRAWHSKSSTYEIHLNLNSLSGCSFPNTVSIYLIEPVTNMVQTASWKSLGCTSKNFWRKCVAQVFKTIPLVREIEGQHHTLAHEESVRLKITPLTIANVTKIMSLSKLSMKWSYEWMISSCCLHGM